MSNTATITIRTNPETKRKSQALFADLGMDMSTAINTFLNQSIAEDGLPFCPRRHEPNAETVDAIKEQGTMDSFSSVDELMEYLNA